MKAAVLGSTGYTGGVLLRLLEQHPQVSNIIPVSSSRPGESLTKDDPSLGKGLTKVPEDTYLSMEEAKEIKPDVVFSALPHLASADACSQFFPDSLVIDLSADFRLSSNERFQSSYGEPWPQAALQNQSVYGLSEAHREQIKTSRLIANPGCYPTATLTPLFPLLKEKLIQGPIIVNAMSGISGAGKKAKTNLLFVERSENMGPYSPGMSHRHHKEIHQEISHLQPDIQLLFNPHLVPLKRGMNATITAQLAHGVGEGAIDRALQSWADGNEFLGYLTENLPQTRNVWNTNRVDFAFRVEGEFIQIFSVIDNLMKGASGQAVQNMNIAFGIHETQGLPLIPPV